MKFAAEDFRRARFATHPTSGKTLERKLAGDAAPWMGELREYRNTDAEMARDGWVPVQEQAGSYTRTDEDWKARAEKAERERDEARANAYNWEATAEEWEKRALAAESRPLTPGAITDEMVERGAVANWRGDVAHPDWTFEDISDEDRGWYRDNARAVLTAALTEPPARPEGAKELGELIGTWTATEDIAPAQLPTGSLATLADFLAERGVRVVAEEMNR